MHRFSPNCWVHFNNLYIFLKNSRFRHYFQLNVAKTSAFLWKNSICFQINWKIIEFPLKSEKNQKKFNLCIFSSDFVIKGALCVVRHQFVSLWLFFFVYAFAMVVRLCCVHMDNSMWIAVDICVSSACTCVLQRLFEHEIRFRDEYFCFVLRFTYQLKFE